MAEKNAAAFLRSNAKTVEVVFLRPLNFNDTSHKNLEKSTLLGPDYAYTSKSYTYVTTMDLEVDDLVIVFAMNCPQVVKVVNVHDDLMIEPESDVEYKWVVSKVDFSAYNALMEENKQIDATVRSSYKMNARRSFQNMLMSSLDEEQRNKLNNLLSHTDKQS